MLNAVEKRTKLFRLISTLTIIVFVTVAVVILSRAFSRSPVSDSVSTEASVSVEPTDTTSIDENSDKAEELKESLLARVHQFSLIYYSFDWSDPGSRQDKLRSFFLEEVAQIYIEQENTEALHQEMIVLQNVKVVEDVKVLQGEIDDSLDLAEVTTEVQILASAPGEESVSFSLPSVTRWVLHDSMWYAYEVVR